MAGANERGAHSRCWRVSLFWRLPVLGFAITFTTMVTIDEHGQDGWLWTPVLALLYLSPFCLVFLPSVCLTDDQVVVRTLFRRKSFSRSEVLDAYAGRYGLSVITRSGGAMAWGIWHTAFAAMDIRWESRADRIASEIRAWAGLPARPPRGRPTPLRRLLRARARQP